MIHRLRLDINGHTHTLEVPSERTLLEMLRDDLALFGAREGCGVEVCGACTVLVDGEPVSACAYIAARANGRRVTTIEGLAPPGDLHPVQAAFLEHGAFQCSYCTPGMVLTVVTLLRDHPDATDEMIRSYLDGNLCRCTAYPEILKAVHSLLGH
jgi:xanthine dehydrogenase YagT iron-sulfur-binding subunit